ncbi:hypothetical protein PTTG_28985 [Puccinia triticina 1-1 BBBD Race 1]|uniref:Integral membrane protein n=2 Tax=Puccinia triticina TaxID=208348 RepID=A0A180G7A9_PUCT1|nr:uncharacterized protein PtA15_10A15 [Puccinia triticina]OAV88587.1 hypothetical protein PTTG_28985 [Puccinia triticina 1-1 BBBD Race 1]WAQ88596.1 hypothetical protein PtA15_10A15 [Puccinia triticina]WAR58678.1 hypothetical protein PtB15_10B16 [Puccinia triticina]
MAASTNVPTLQNTSDHDLTGVVFGFTLGFGFFVICHAVKRTRKICAFTIMTWLTILVTSISSWMVFFNLENVVHRPLAYYVVLSILWSIQSQCVLQIIVNRVVLIWSNPVHIRWLRWGVFIWATLINLSAIPVRIQISAAYTKFETFWEPCEKTLCLLTDAFLNVTFIFSVRRTLISNGLTKYNELVKFNVLVIGLSIALDLGIVSSMFMHGSLPYESLNSLSGFVKLKTELLMSELIVKVMQSENMMKMMTQSNIGSDRSDALIGNGTSASSIYRKGNNFSNQEEKSQGARDRKFSPSPSSRPQLRMSSTAPPGGFYQAGLSSFADLELGHSSSVDLHSPCCTSRSKPLSINGGWETLSPTASLDMRRSNELLIPVKS